MQYEKYIEPTAGRVVAVRWEEEEATTKSGIILVGNQENKQTPQIMELTHVAADLASTWQPGDIIAIPMYSGIKVKILENEFYILDEKEILGRVVTAKEDNYIHEVDQRVTDQLPGQMEFDLTNDPFNEEPGTGDVYVDWSKNTCDNKGE